FLGGTFSLSVGIWVMNFMELIAFNISNFSTYPFLLNILSILIGMFFIGMAFAVFFRKFVNNGQIIFGSLFLTLGVISVHVIGIFSLNLNITYQVGLFSLSCIVIFGSFLFSLWLLYFFKGFTFGNQAWLKPASAITITVAIAGGHLLLKKALLSGPNEIVTGSSTVNIFIFYNIFFVSILIFGGLISSSILKSKILAVSDTNLKDIKSALDESSIVAITDQFGTILYVNDKFEEISKFKREEILGQNHRILNSGYHPKVFFKNMWQTIGEGHVWKGEICNRAKDGTIYWVDTTVVPFLNEKGKPYQYIAIRTDISNLKKAEEDLKQTLKENIDIKFALDHSSIVTFTDANGLITSVNDKFCEISKYSREEIIGKNHRVLNSGLHSKAVFKGLWETITAGKIWKGELRNLAKDGAHYWVDTTIIPFLNEEGKPYQFLSIRNDITERKQTQEFLQRQEKLAAVGQLAAGVAHEIRNPLTSMKGYTEFLQLDEKDPERIEFLNIILDEIERVNTIVDDFMVLAKPRAVELEEKNVIPVLKHVISLLEFEAKKKNVRLHFDYFEEIIQIECDEGRLKQVFLNFIKNGIEAMPNGGDLNVRTFIQDHNVQISIQDTGVGIPKEKLTKLGEPFYTTKKNGNGLGLMVSFKIIESHNGKVFVESELNKGTTFNILLPAKTA
ncbi:MAG: PAS domain S-box protein, partial [Bacillota bacterium]|nr:PAS domain S-box protein [Bacillota bacterium]